MFKLPGTTVNSTEKERKEDVLRYFQPCNILQRYRSWKRLLTSLDPLTALRSRNLISVVRKHAWLYQMQLAIQQWLITMATMKNLLNINNSTFILFCDWRKELALKKTNSPPEGLSGLVESLVEGITVFQEGNFISNLLVSLVLPQLAFPHIQNYLKLTFGLGISKFTCHTSLLVWHQIEALFLLVNENPKPIRNYYPLQE